MAGKKRKTRNSTKTEVVEIKIEDDENDDKNNDVTEKDNKEDKDKNKDEEDGYVWSKHRYMTCIKKSLLKFKCDRCDYATTTKGSLRSHMFTHSDEFPFPCPYCEYKGKRHTYLKKHMLHKHYNLCNMNMLRTPDDDYYKS